MSTSDDPYPWEISPDFCTITGKPRPKGTYATEAEIQADREKKLKGSTYVPGPPMSRAEAGEISDDADDDLISSDAEEQLNKFGAEMRKQKQKQKQKPTTTTRQTRSSAVRNSANSDDTATPTTSTATSTAHQRNMKRHSASKPISKTTPKSDDADVDADDDAAPTPTPSRLADLYARLGAGTGTGTVALTAEQLTGPGAPVKRVTKIITSRTLDEMCAPIEAAEAERKSKRGKTKE